MKQVIRGFVGRIKGLKGFQKVLIVVLLLVLLIAGKVCTAQFYYSEAGYVRIHLHGYGDTAGATF